MQECRSHPTPTRKTCLWTPAAGVAGPILSSDASVTAELVCLPIRPPPILCRISHPCPGLTAAFCPCIVYSKISTRLDHLNKSGSPHPSGGDACGGSCIGYAATCCIGVACILQVRVSVSAGFNRRMAQPFRRQFNEATPVADTTSLVTVAPISLLHAAAMFATLSKSLVKLSSRRTVTGNSRINLYSFPT
jgi:hypothetical protein